jgi:hypothetical protein
MTRKSQVCTVAVPLFWEAAFSAIYAGCVEDVLNRTAASSGSHAVGVKRLRGYSTCFDATFEYELSLPAELTAVKAKYHVAGVRGSTTKLDNPELIVVEFV